MEEAKNYNDKNPSSYSCSVYSVDLRTHVPRYVHVHMYIDASVACKTRFSYATVTSVRGNGSLFTF